MDAAPPAFNVQRQVVDSIQSAVLPIINEAVKNIEEEHSKKLKRKQRELREANAKIIELQSQLACANQASKGLKHALDAYLITSHASVSLDDISSSQSPVPFEEYDRLKRKLTVLSGLLDESQKKRADEAAARTLLIEKLRSAKDAAKEWKSVADKLRVKGIPSASARKRPSSTDIEELEDVEEFLQRIDAMSDGLSIISAQNPTTEDQLINSPDVPEQQAIPSSQQETVPGDLTIFSGSVNDRVIPDSDDKPLVVDERAVKRRRTKEDSFTKPRIKQEPMSPHDPFLRTNTLDLDHVGEHLTIPRELRVSDILSERVGHNVKQRASEPPANVDIKDISIVANGNIEAENVSPIRSQSHSSIVMQPPTPLLQSAEKRAILSPIDANARSGPKKKRARISMEKAMQDIAEDDQIDRYRKNQAAKRGRDSTLQALLEGNIQSTIPAKKITPTRKKPQTPKQNSFAMLNDLDKTSNFSDFERDSRSTEKPLDQGSIRHKLRSRNGTRLRDKLKESLLLSDFKVNPKMNGGVDFAFKDAVYGAARKCFPGCTDSRCCGDAIRVVAATMKPILPRPVFPASQEDLGLTDDEFMLKWYMGGTWNLERVRGMEDPEREKHLLDARTKYLAEKFGKHRTVGDRRMTPPGFWDVDMPSTQEFEKQRHEAVILERRMVEERYNEAMRGGKWLFADE